MLGIGTILYPAWHFVLTAAVPGCFDPLLDRLILAAIGVLCACLGSGFALGLAERHEIRDDLGLGDFLKRSNMEVTG
jgi:hypothetical protein